MLWIILIIALFASSLFAGSETGYYGVNALRLKHEARESRNSALLEKIIRQPSAFLATLLFVGAWFTMRLTARLGRGDMW